MSRILVEGSLAYDRIMDYPAYFRDSIVADKIHSINVSFLIESVTEQFGGTAGNIAYNLALLGATPHIIASVGDDFERYRARLDHFQISSESIAVVPGERTASAYIITDRADNQITAFHPGAAAHAYGGALPVAADIAIIAPGAAADMRALPEHCRKHGIRFCFDPSQQLPALSADDLRTSIEGSTILFGNDYELGLIVQKTGWNESELLKHAAVLVITSGEQGTRIVTREGELRIPSVRVKNVVDPTGAGDAHRAGFLSALLAGASYAVAGRVGNTVASFCIEQHGTQEHTFTHDDLRTRYTEAYGEDMPELV